VPTRWAERDRARTFSEALRASLADDPATAGLILRRAPGRSGVRSLTLIDHDTLIWRDQLFPDSALALDLFRKLTRFI
jgi:hypothetical protein